MTASPNRPVRVLFSGHDFKFITPLIDRLRRSDRYEVRLEEHRGHEINSEREARECADWADIIFCEWALGNAVWHSRHKRPDQFLVVRLHLQEVQARDRIRYIYDTDWQNVDKLILICHHMHDFMTGEFPVLRDGRACLVYNPIDARGALDRPKLPGAEFNLGMVGIVPQRKRLDLAVETLLELKKYDDRFTLSIKGQRPEQYAWMKERPGELAWYETIYRRIEASPHANSIVFEPHGADMPQWYSKIGFILSPSDFEGSHQSVAEGMASGCIPIIRDWEGADRIYPPKYVIGTVEEAARAVLKWKAPRVCQDEMEYCRAFARERFDQREICDRIEGFFTEYLRRTRPELAPAEGASAAPARVPPVLILGYLPVGYQGGYRIRIEQEIKMLAGLGGRVHLACLHPEAKPEALEAHRTTLEALGCTVHMIPTAHFFDIKLDETIARAELDALERILDTHGLRIVNAEALYSSRLGLLLKRRRPQVRLVFDCHGASPEEERMSGAHPARVSTMEKWEREVLAAADLNIFVSEAMNNYYLGRYGITSLPHAVVPCSVADDRFPPEGAPSPLDGLPAGRPIIAYLGTLAAWQCSDETIRLFAQLQRYDPRFFFLVVAPRADHAKAQALMEKHGLPASGALLASLTHAQVPAALARAHAGVLLRRAHPVNMVSSPTKFGEYLAAGLPVIMTDGIGDFSALGAESGLGLVLESSLLDLPEFPPSEIARVAEFVEQSLHWRRPVASRCRLMGREHLHWDVVAGNLARAYRNLHEV